MQDDMAQLLQKYRESDLVVLYTWNMTALLKNFADRLAPLKSPGIKEENGNFDLQDARAKTQTFAVISNCGFPAKTILTCSAQRLQAVIPPLRSTAAAAGC